MAFRRRRYRARRPRIGRRTRRTIRRIARRKYRRIPRGVSTLSNFPQIQKLRYVETIGITCTAGATGIYQFRANSLYDPNLTGIGHQPMRYDQCATFFADYVVVGSKITIRHVGSGDGNANATKVVLYLNDTSAAAPLDVDAWIEQGRCRYFLTNDNTGKSQQKASLGFSAKRFFNITNIKDNVKRIGAVVSDNPADVAIFTIGCTPMDMASTTITRLHVVIDYLAIFSQPVLLAQS